METAYIIESGNRLSRSKIWEWQRKWFMEQGKEAFATDTVPSWITNSPWHAHACGEVFTATLLDQIASGNPEKEYFCLEAGAGTGRFAFHFLWAISDFLEQHPEIRFRYILTDIAESSLEFAMQHPRLKPWIDKGILDFAVYDAGSTDVIQLIRSGDLLEPGYLKNPLFVIANYYFDSLKQDVFKVEKGEIKEGLVQLSGPMVAEGEAVPPDKIRELYDYQPLDWPYYEIPEWDHILMKYQSGLQDATFTFPVEGLESMDFLSSLSEKGAFFLVADKGPNLIGGLESGKHAKLSRHGAISLSVNFHAIGEYITSRGGLKIDNEHPYRMLNTALYYNGSGKLSWDRTQQIFRNKFIEFGSDDITVMRETHKSGMGIKDISYWFSYFRLGKWDPELIRDQLNLIVTLLPQAAASVKESFVAGFRKAWENYYDIGEKTDIAFMLGGLSVACDDFREALRFFAASWQAKGPNPIVAMNIVRCLAQLQSFDEAEKWLEAAEQCGAKAAQVKALREQIRSVR